MATIAMKFQRSSVRMFNLTADEQRSYVTFPSIPSTHFDHYHPIGFGLKGLYLIVPVHTEAKRRCLTWTVGDATAI